MQTSTWDTKEFLRAINNQRSIYRPRVDNDKGCKIYSKVKSSLPANPLLSNGVSQSPWQKVHAKFFDWSGEHWLLVSDSFNKDLFLTEAKWHRAPTVIAFLSDIFTMEGTLAKFFIDIDLIFNSKALSLFAAQWGFVHTTSISLYLQ